MIADDPLHAEGADTAGQVPEAVRHPPWLLAAAAAAAVAMLIIALLGTVIYRGHQFAFDRALLLAMRGGEAAGAPVGPPWLQQAMLDVTALGGGTVLVIVIALTSGYLAMRRLWLTMWLVLGGTISGSLAVALAKQLFARARPDLTDHLVTVSSASFPSGHAANSAIVYLTLATLIVQIVEERGSRHFILGGAALVVTAVGCSRVYLGVHWPSDVLAGWG